MISIFSFVPNGPLLFWGMIAIGAMALFAAIKQKRGRFIALVFAAVFLWFPMNVAIGRYEVCTTCDTCISFNLSGCFRAVGS